MPYLPLELDGKKAMVKVARASGVPPGEVMWGLSELWEYVWTTKQDVVAPVVVLGCMGHSVPADTLVAFGFLEPVEEGFRVRGAGRLLAVSEARKKGAESTNAKRRSATLSVQNEPQKHAERTVERRSSDAPEALLHPEAQHPTPKLPKEEAPPLSVVKNDWDGDVDFWNWFQSRRRAAGFVKEKPPNSKALADFWREALEQLQGDPEPLRETVFRFGDDPYWQKRDLPFAAFAKNWPKYVPRGAVAHDA